MTSINNDRSNDNSSDTGNNEPWYSVMAGNVPLAIHTPFHNSTSISTMDGNVSKTATATHEHKHKHKQMLFVGSLSAAECLSFIKEFQITHILTVAAGLDVNIPVTVANDTNSGNNGSEYTVQHLVVECHDHPMASILEVLPQCLNFIHQGLLGNEHGNIHETQYKIAGRTESVPGRVLVHCASGVSRSVAVCAAYLMTMNRGMDKIAHSDIMYIKAAEAIASIASVRKYANPNLGFRRQLEILERCCKMTDGTTNEKREQEEYDYKTDVYGVVKTATKEFAKIQGNVVEDTIRQRTLVNDLHAEVDEMEKRLAAMKSSSYNKNMPDNGDVDHNCIETLVDSDNTDNGYGDDAYRVTEKKEIENLLLSLQEQLDSCLPIYSEGLVDPPARMIRKSAIAKAKRLLDEISR